MSGQKVTATEENRMAVFGSAPDSCCEQAKSQPIPNETLKADSLERNVLIRNFAAIAVGWASSYSGTRWSKFLAASPPPPAPVMLPFPARRESDPVPTLAPRRRGTVLQHKRD